MKINGITVGTPTPRSNFNQTDSKKADYLIGRENIATKEFVEEAIGDVILEASGGIGEIVQTTGDSMLAVMSQKATTKAITQFAVPREDLTLVYTINLFNPNKVTAGYYIDPTNGKTVAGSSYSVTDYIPVIGGQTYTLNVSRRFAWYDANKAYISGKNGGFSGSAPANAAYIRISVLKNGDPTLMFTPTAKTPATYIPYGVTIPELYKEITIDDFLVEGAYRTANIYNSATNTDGYYVDILNGVLGANSIHTASQFIKCKAETSYSTNIKDSFRICAYDNNFVFLEGKNYSSENGNTYTTPANTAYIRISVGLENKYKLVLVEGDTHSLMPVPFGIVAPWLQTEKSKYAGKKMVCFGDSITYNNYTDTIYSDTGIEAINVGMPSARYAFADDAENEKNAFALHNIVDAICTGDWTTPDKIIGVSGYESHAKQLALMKTIDFNTIDFVSFAYGTNDYTSGTPIVDTDDLYDINTVTGALRYSVKTLLTSYPHLRILVSLPIYRFFVSDGVIVSDGDTLNLGGGGTLAEYCEAISNAAKSVHIPFVDCYNNGGINAFNRLHYFDISDGTHPNAKGQAVIGHNIAEGILKYL